MKANSQGDMVLRILSPYFSREHGSARLGNKAPWVLITCYGFVLTLAFIFVDFVPRPAAEVAVLVSPFAPRSEAAHLVALAGGHLLAGARWPFIVVAESGQTDFTERLYHAGAWLVFNPGISAGCLRKI